MKPQVVKPAVPMIGENVSRVVKIMLVRDEMRQQDLAEVLGYDAGTVTRKIKGLREWKITDLVAMAEFFEIPVAWFFDDPDTLIRSPCFRRTLISA